MIGLGSSIAKPGKIGKRIVRDGLVLKHDYNAGAVQPCSTGAAYFDGTNDYITMGDVCDLGTADFSIALWIWTSDVDDNFFISKHQDGDDEWYMRIGQATNNNNGKIQFHSVVTAAGTEISGLSGTQGAIKANEWTHLAITNDRSDTSAGLKFYINGVADGTEACSTINMDNTGSLHISRYHNSYYSNYLCNVGIWSAALTQTQIKSIMHKDYAALSASEKTNLVSWWNLDSAIPGVSTEVYDNHYAGGSELGSELITNGDFSSASGWTLSSDNGDSTAEISGGTLNITVGAGDGYIYGSQPEASMSAPYAHESIYVMEATFTRTSGDGGKLRFQDNLADNGGLTDSQTETELTGNEQSVKFYFKANSSSNTLAIARDNGASGLPVTVKVKSISLKKVNGNIGTLA